MIENYSFFPENVRELINEIIFAGGHRTWELLGSGTAKRAQLKIKQTNKNYI